MFARVWTVILVAFAEAALRVVTLVVERFEVPDVLRVVAKRLAAFITKALPLV